MTQIIGKTPLAFLEEHARKNKIEIKFDLIEDGTGSHAPTFKYECKVSGKTVHGEGRTKKIAKQQAAQKVIEQLELVNNEKVAAVIQVGKPEITENINYVGDLEKYCKAKGYPAPLYKDEHEGQDHAKEFIVTCIVSEKQEIAKSGKKRTARQHSACRMLKRLKSELNEVSDTDEPNKSSAAVIPDKAVKSAEASSSTGEAYEYRKSAKSPEEFDAEINHAHKRYKEVKGEDEPENSAVTDKYTDQHRALVGLHKKSDTLTQLVNNQIVNSSELAVELLTAIADELGVEKDLRTYNTNAKNVAYMYLYKISTIPPVSAVGKDENTAANELLKTLVEMCKE